MPTFKEYYQNPEFKARHLAYMKQKVVCSCGKLVARSNMTKHKYTSTHQKRKEIMNDPMKAKLKEFYEKYKDLLDQVDERLR